jgi:GGDEF domain-containing protein
MPRWEFRPHATIVDQETFACVAELETRQAARLQYAVSMLTIHGRREAGGAAPDDAARQLAEVVSPMIRNTDVVAIGSSVATVRVLLVGGDSDNLPGIIQRIIAEVSHYRVDDEPAVVVSIGGSCFPATAASSRELLLQADAMAEEARRERGPSSAYRLRERSGSR